MYAVGWCIASQLRLHLGTETFFGTNHENVLTFPMTQLQFLVWGGGVLVTWPISSFVIRNTSSSPNLAKMVGPSVRRGYEVRINKILPFFHSRTRVNRRTGIRPVSMVEDDTGPRVSIRLYGFHSYGHFIAHFIPANKRVCQQQYQSDNKKHCAPP